MKRLLLTLALFSIPSLCHAFGSQVPGLVYQVGVSSITQFFVPISTQGPIAPGATQVDSPQLVGRATVEVQNLDTAANLWCLAVSTNPAANRGRKIAAGSSWIININDKASQQFNQTSFKLWCLSDGVAASTACVTQLY